MHLHVHYVVYSIQQFCVDIIKKSKCLLDYFVRLGGGGRVEIIDLKYYVWGRREWKT